MSGFDKPTSYRAVIFSLLLAIGFWLVVKISGRYDYRVDIPLQVTINNPEVTLKYPAPDSVTVLLSGRGLDLLRLSLYEAIYAVDLSDESGNYLLNLNANREYVKLPTQVKAEVRSVIRPHEINFELDSSQVRKIPVVVNTSISTANGFILTDIKTTPDSLLLSGPVSFVDTLQSFFTLPERFEDIDQSFSVRTGIRQVGKQYNIEYPTEIEVFYDVQRLAEKTFTDIAVELQNVPSNMEVVVLPSNASVYVKGGDKILAECTAENFIVTVDLESRRNAGKAKVWATVETEAPILAAEVRPSQFDLIIRKKD